MYIISDLEGNLIQKANLMDVDLTEIVNRLSVAMNKELIFTTNEQLYKKSETTGYFNIIVTSNEIVDIEVVGKPTLIEMPEAPTSEERISALEDAISFMLGL